MVLESNIEPPAFFSTLMSSISMENFSPSLFATARTAFTVKPANSFESLLTSFVCIAVLAILSKTCLSLGETSSEISCKYCSAFFDAFL